MPVARSHLRDALLEGRLVPKGKDEAFCVPSLPNENSNKKNIHLIGIFLILSPRKKRLLYMESIKKNLPNAKEVHENTCHLTQIVEVSTIYHNTSAKTVAMRLCNS